MTSTFAYLLPGLVGLGLATGPMASSTSVDMASSQVMTASKSLTSTAGRLRLALSMPGYRKPSSTKK